MATRTVSISGGNYSSTSTWDEGAVPTNADDVVFTATSGNLTVNVASVAKTFDCTNWTGTITMNNTLTVSGNVTLVSVMTITGSFGLILDATATITSNGKLISNLILSGSATITQMDTLNCGNLTINTSNVSLSSIYDINVNGNLTLNQSLNVISGSPTINMIGSGIWSGAGSTNAKFNINTAGTIQLQGTTTHRDTLFKLTAGTVITTGNNFISNFSTIDASGIAFNNFTPSGVTLANDININGNLTFGSNGSMVGYVANLAGNLICTANMSGYSPTTIINFMGTGDQTWSGNFYHRNPITINKPSGTMHIGDVSWDALNAGIAFNYVAGLVVSTGTFSYGNTGNTATFNSDGIVWNNFNVNRGGLILNSLLTVNGTLNVGASGDVTFGGTHGFTCHTFSCTTAGRTINFATGKTYSVTNNLTITGSVGNRVSFVSTSTGALFNLQAGASQSVTNCNAIWVDSSGGQTIYSNPSTLTNTINWSSSNRFIPWFNSQF